jgi:glycosyltransferase involved in cell wall biosynthesis
VIAQRRPHPARGGGELRVGQTIDGLAQLAEVSVFVLEDVPAAVQHADDRASQRQALAWLREPGAHPSDLWWTPDALTAVRDVLSRVRPDVVVVEHLWMRGALPAARAAGCRVVLDAHNVEAQVHEDLASSAEGGAPRALARRLAVRTAEIETATVHAVDQVWAPSDEDVQRLASRYAPAASLHVIPNGVALDGASLGGSRTCSGRSPCLLFPASFGYPPNVAAALFLADEVLPLVQRDVVDARLVLAGHLPPSALRAIAAERPDVTVTGTVAEMAPYFAEATVVPVPLAEGGGTRYKILEAFAAGVPVVTTAKGIEGIAAQPGRDYLPANTAEEFAEAIVRLAAAPAQAARLTASARQLVRQRYSREATDALIATAVAALLHR